MKCFIRNYDWVFDVYQYEESKIPLKTKVNPLEVVGYKSPTLAMSVVTHALEREKVTSG